MKDNFKTLVITAYKQKAPSMITDNNVMRKVSFF